MSMGTWGPAPGCPWGPVPGCPEFHRDVRTWGSSPGCPQCHRDMGTCPGMWGGCSPWGWQPRGGWHCHPGWWYRAPRAPKGAPRAIAGSGAEQRKKRQRQGEGNRSQVPSLSPPWGRLPAFQLPQPAEPACRCSSIIQHQPGRVPHPPHRIGQRVPVLSPVPMAALGRPVHWGHMVGDTWTRAEAPHVESAGLPCLGCSVPQFPHTALDTFVSGEE